MKWFIKNNEIFESFKSDPSVKLTTKLSFLLLAFCLGLFVLTFKRLPPRVPLFYSLPWGEQQLSPTIGLLFLPLGMLLVAVLNSFFIMAILNKYSLAAKILTWITVALIFLTSVTLVKIIFLIL